MALDIFTGVQADLSTVDFGATAEADFNAAVDLALNTVIPASPTAGSVNAVLKEIDEHLHAFGFNVIGSGTFTTASVTVPADTSRTEANGYWDKCWIVPTQAAGLELAQPRQIASYAKTGGVFTMQTGTTWLSAPTGTYDIWSNGTGKNVLALGTLTTSSVSVPADNRRMEVTGYWNGCQLLPLTGAAANQPRNIALFTATTGVFSLPSGALFTTLPGAVTYAIVRGTQDQVPAVDSTSALTYKSTVGNKADAAVTTVGATASILAYIKGVLNQLVTAIAAPASALAAVAYTRQAGVMQVKATTFELNQAAAVYTLLTGTTQDVEIESVTVRNLTNMTGGGTTSFSVQTNDTTAQTFISNTSAVAAQLTVGAQFSWVGACILKVGKLIQITVNGAASGGTDVMDVVVCYRAIVSGGYLA
jgi:hypothetical protein